MPYSNADGGTLEWVYPTTVNSVFDADAPFGYGVDTLGVVHLTGVITTYDVVGAVIHTLPEGVRPPVRTGIALELYNTDTLLLYFRNMTIEPTGEISFEKAFTHPCYIKGITFLPRGI